MVLLHSGLLKNLNSTKKILNSGWPVNTSKKTKSPQKLSSKAKKIYTDFIEKEAPKEINIDFQTKTLIAQNIQEATSGCFTTAQKRVYSLMENNSYPRFLESEFYQDLCKKPQITTEPHAT